LDKNVSTGTETGKRVAQMGETGGGSKVQREIVKKGEEKA